MTTTYVFRILPTVTEQFVACSRMIFRWHSGRSYSNGTTLLLGTVALFGVVGCASQGVRDSATHSSTGRSAVVSPLAVTVESPRALGKINSLAVVSPLFNPQARAAQIDAGRVTELVLAAAERELDLKVYDPTWVGKVLPKNAGYSPDRDRGLLKKNGADGTLVTELLEFTERVGSSVGGDPAAVAFSVSVLDNSTGEAVWRGTFSHRQEALTDNLLKIGDRFGQGGSGPGWSTAVASFERGLIEAFRNLRSTREKQFLVSEK